MGVRVLDLRHCCAVHIINTLVSVSSPCLQWLCAEIALVKSPWLPSSISLPSGVSFTRSGCRNMRDRRITESACKAEYRPINSVGLTTDVSYSYCTKEYPHCCVDPVQLGDCSANSLRKCYDQVCLFLLPRSLLQTSRVFLSIPFGVHGNLSTNNQSEGLHCCRPRKFFSTPRS